MSFYDNTTGGDTHEEIFQGIDLVKASRTACIICGHPTGDCKNAHSDGPKHIVTLGKDEELSEVDMYTVEEDIWEERPITKTSTSRFLVARKGRQITRKKAAELGII